MEFGREVHLESASKLGRRAEGEVDVLAEHLCDVRPRDIHPLGELSLRRPAASSAGVSDEGRQNRYGRVWSLGFNHVEQVEHVGY